MLTSSRECQAWVQCSLLHIPSGCLPAAAIMTQHNEPGMNARLLQCRMNCGTSWRMPSTCLRGWSSQKRRRQTSGDRVHRCMGACIGISMHTWRQCPSSTGMLHSPYNLHLLGDRGVFCGEVKPRIYRKLITHQAHTGTAPLHACTH